jgi:hypothetical protein
MLSSGSDHCTDALRAGISLYLSDAVAHSDPPRTARKPVFKLSRWGMYAGLNMKLTPSFHFATVGPTFAIADASYPSLPARSLEATNTTSTEPDESPENISSAEPKYLTSFAFGNLLRKTATTAYPACKPTVTSDASSNIVLSVIPTKTAGSVVASVYGSVKDKTEIAVD